MHKIKEKYKYYSEYRNWYLPKTNQKMREEEKISIKELVFLLLQFIQIHYYQNKKKKYEKRNKMKISLFKIISLVS